MQRVSCELLAVAPIANPPRTLSSIVCVRSDIYIFTWEQLSSQSGRVRIDIAIFNVIARVWRWLDFQLPYEVESFSPTVAAVGNYIILRIDLFRRCITFVLDTVEESCIKMPSAPGQPTPPTSFGYTLTLVSLPEEGERPAALRGDYLIQLGGKSGNRYTNQVFGLCLQSKTWHKLYDPDEVSCGNDAFLLNRLVWIIAFADSVGLLQCI